ncbi:iron chaperone [Pedobacter jamesrossensis]|uniref:Iron chaperone n=1 Tax=Pedobacter jamesrossensis TaxID=1908238 RepID=A0ABV8NFJ7_9SPHI
MDIKITDVESYIAGFPKETQELLEQMRQAIKKIAPKATEKIGYGIPTFVLNGNLVHYAGYKNHIGFYPGAGSIEQFKEELSIFKSAKGSVQFPLDKPLPLGLVSKITEFRVAQNEQKALLKTNKENGRKTK